MGKKKEKKEKKIPIPFRLDEVGTGRVCVTTESKALLNAVLDRRHELYTDVKLRLWIDGEIWTEAVPHVIKHQIARKDK